MEKLKRKNDMKRIILSGGGTGGHIYPAVAVAEALKRRLGDEVELLFVGAEGKMEMEKVPALGYRIVGLPIAGLQRRLDWHNLLVPLKVLRSLRMARRVIRDFGADAVVGFGGYASAPVLWAAQHMGVPTVIQEQNSYAGVTNKILARRARRICTAYEGMERFFPSDRITLTGNPLRGRFSKQGADRTEALKYYGLTADLPTILVVGGSLGTRSLNEMMKQWILDTGGKAPVQVIWQTGKYYEREMQAFWRPTPRRMSGRGPSSNAWTTPMRRPIWSSRAVVPARFRSCVWWLVRCSSCPRPTWPKTTRRRMPGPLKRRGRPWWFPTRSAARGPCRWPWSCWATVSGWRR